jgi:uncharacterized protein (TIGR00369 family)
MTGERSRSSRNHSLADRVARQAKLKEFGEAEHPRCFLCATGNERGLGLHFRVQPDGSVVALFPCREVFQSYPETLHGGVISALLDAAMTTALFSIGVVGVTAEMTVRYLAPVVLDRGAVIRASIERDTRPLYYVHSTFEQERKLMARATAKFLVKGCLQ